ncbi:hypothetical protein OLEAN_C37350 [Oleispira antarctica RB-8]|uniref:Uncharacterized protein n=1 Tax=Oleispira antarctica RB-8 TaxID=698738 RepID=R4YRS4_OLEAN|nr:hypothetical protein OLEAN_C37350 [Oleispira antarctica RB-8]
MHLINLPFKASILATTIALTACGGDSSSNNSSSNNSSAESVPIGLANNASGTSVISAKGGNADYQAGDGGSIEISKNYSSAPLNITVSGLPDTNYDLPDVTVNLGSNPALITTSMTITTSNPSIEAGDLYLHDNRMYRYDGIELNTESTIITGLSIAEGAVLTLDPVSSQAQLFFYQDIKNDGEITVATAAMATSASDLSLIPFNYFGSGDINLSGKEIGQNAGSLLLYANIIQNSGSINTSGANGDATTAGGQSGSATVFGLTFTENTGTILANSGSSTGGSAGATEDIEILSVRYLVNTGNVSASAGAGVNVNNVISGGDISITANNLLLNTGNITANGSTSILNAAESDGGEGGHGGDIQMYLGGEGLGTFSAFPSPRLINTGELQANGGDSADNNYIAGNGGSIDLKVTESDDGDKTRMNPVMVAISGNLSADGGNTTETSGSNSARAGSGGDIDIKHDSQLIAVLPTQIVGYTSMNTSGGNGLQAGDAGDIDIKGGSNSDARAEIYAPAPSINIATDLELNGGNVITSAVLSQTAQAGRGGDMNLQILSQHQYAQDSLNLSFNGTISANASDVSNGSSSQGGTFNATAPQDVTIRGNISLNGSNDTAIPDIGENDGYNKGGDGGYFSMGSQFGSVDFDAQVAAKGGAGQIEGGEGGGFVVNSLNPAKVNGSINVAGGNASITAVNAQETEGGDGGLLIILSQELNTNLSASYTFSPGTGTENGVNGGIFVDANCLSGVCQKMLFNGQP